MPIYIRVESAGRLVHVASIVPTGERTWRLEHHIEDKPVSNFDTRKQAIEAAHCLWPRNIMQEPRF